MSQEQFTLDSLIQKIRTLDANLEVWIEHGHELRKVSGFISWRGNYCDLSIESAYESDFTSTISVSHFLGLANFAIGATFVGWKGGEFTMDLSTLVWGDASGLADEYTPYDIRVENGKAIIETFLPYEQDAPCSQCGGVGWTIDYDWNDPSGSTPIQAQCDCTGYFPKATLLENEPF